MSEGEDILGGVTAVLQRYNPTGRAIEPETDLAADLNVDSVAAMDLIMEIEDRFEIDIPINLVADMTTVADLAALVVGHTPVSLNEAAADLCQLLAWQGGAIHPDLRADAQALEVQATVASPDGRSLRLRARLRAFRTGGDDQLRVMAVVEDRSFEDERDLAQLEIGALMDTAGIGVATYEASRGWTQSRASATGKPASGLQPALQSIRREQVEPSSVDEFERLQRALRQGERAQVRYEVRVPELGRRWLEPDLFRIGASSMPKTLRYRRSAVSAMESRRSDSHDWQTNTTFGASW